MSKLSLHLVDNLLLELSLQSTTCCLILHLVNNLLSDFTFSQQPAVWFYIQSTTCCLILHLVNNLLLELSLRLVNSLLSELSLYLGTSPQCVACCGHVASVCCLLWARRLSVLRAVGRWRASRTCSASWRTTRTSWCAGRRACPSSPRSGPCPAATPPTTRSQARARCATPSKPGVSLRPCRLSLAQFLIRPDWRQTGPCS